MSVKEAVGEGYRYNSKYFFSAFKEPGLSLTCVNFRMFCTGLIQDAFQYIMCDFYNSGVEKILLEGALISPLVYFLS